MNSITQFTAQGNLVGSLLPATTRAHSLPLPSLYFGTQQLTHSLKLISVSPEPATAQTVSTSSSADPSLKQTAQTQTLTAQRQEDIFRKLEIGGHRGFGTNLLTKIPGILHPCYRENTLRSLQAAFNCGASFVEFDVQVTRDGVVVLWHDDDVIYNSPETGLPTSMKVADLTLAEFKALVSKKAPPAEGEPNQQQGVPQTTSSLLRHFGGSQGHLAPDGLLPWAVELDDELPTLDQIFLGLPECVGFDLEVKMAVPDTVAVTPADEVQRMLAPILKVVQRQTGPGSTRSIIFSSFDPDVCIALKAQQSRFPIVFLSGCGLYPHVDGRRTSIDTAIGTAMDADLSGIVVPASILLANASMVAAAKAASLVVLTYGLENNDPENVRQQALMGAKAVIVDEVEQVVSHFKRPLVPAAAAAAAVVALTTTASTMLPPFAFEALPAMTTDRMVEAGLERVSST